MIDYGTGSGVLAVAALLLGAGQAVGTDVDPLAVKAAAQNARLNGVEEKLQVLVCSASAEEREEPLAAAAAAAAGAAEAAPAAAGLQEPQDEQAKQQAQQQLFDVTVANILQVWPTHQRCSARGTSDPPHSLTFPSPHMPFPPAGPPAAAGPPPGWLHPPRRPPGAVWRAAGAGGSRGGRLHPLVRGVPGGKRGPLGAGHSGAAAVAVRGGGIVAAEVQVLPAGAGCRPQGPAASAPAGAQPAAPSLSPPGGCQPGSSPGGRAMLRGGLGSAPPAAAPQSPRTPV